MNTGQYRRRNGCGWVLWIMPLSVICCLGVLLLAPAVPGLALRLFGFKPGGSVDEFWETLSQETPAAVVQIVPSTTPINENVAVDSQPTAVTSTATPVQVAVGGGSGGVAAVEAVQATDHDWFQTVNVPGTITLDAGTGAITMDVTQLYAQEVLFGRGTDGLPLGVITYGEDNLDAVCEVWLGGCADDGYAVNRVEFGPGGLVLYGSADVGGLRQDAGLILVLGSDARSLRAAGLVLSGQVYAVPDNGDIASLINEAETEVNSALSNLRVQAGSYDLRLSQIRFAVGRVTFVFR